MPVRPHQHALRRRLHQPRAGVFTWDAWQNAAFGTAPLNLKQMSVLWQTELAPSRTGDSGTLSHAPEADRAASAKCRAVEAWT